MNFQFRTLQYQQQLCEAQVQCQQLCACKVFQDKHFIYVEFNFKFLGGSLAQAEAHKIIKACQLCEQQNLPLIIRVASGGVRMQEGIVALQAMYTTTRAIQKLNSKNILTIAILEDPCFGGSSASFAYECLLRLSVKGARIGFAGPDVIKNTIYNGDQQLYDSTVPPGFQTADRIAKLGFIDYVGNNITEVFDIAQKICKLYNIQPQYQFIEKDSTSQSAYGTNNYRDVRLSNILPINIVEQLFTDIIPLINDNAIQCSFAKFKGQPVSLIYNIKTSTDELSGLGTAEGYRLATRFIDLSSKMNLAIITLVNTPGACPTCHNEERQIAEAISKCISVSSQCKSPIISILCGEGGSGGALSIMCANSLACLELSYYSVISAEGAVSILQKSIYGKSEEQKQLAKQEFNANCDIIAKQQGCYPQQLKDYKVIDYIIPGQSLEQISQECKNYISKELTILSKLDEQQIQLQRENRFQECNQFKVYDSLQEGLKEARNYLQHSPHIDKKKFIENKISSYTEKCLKFIAEKTIENKNKNFIFKQPKMFQMKDKSFQNHKTMKQIFLEKGRDYLMEFILSQKNNPMFTDTSFRDAHQSLSATRLRTKELIQAAIQLEQTQYPYASEKQLFSVECFGGATFDTCMRFLQENPYDRLKEFCQVLPNTLTQMLFRGSNGVGYTKYPDNVIEQFIIQTADAGVDIFRIFDAFNDINQMDKAIQTVLNKTNKIVQVCICFSGNFLDPNEKVYTLQYYEDLVQKYIDKWPKLNMIVIKDMAGLFSANMAEQFMAMIQKVTKSKIPIGFHTHDTSGAQIATCLAMIKNGCQVIDCSTSSYSGLTSQPCLQSMLRSLDANYPYLENLNIYDHYFEQIRQMYSQVYENKISSIRSPQSDVYQIQYPGGQISNLFQQCINMGLGDKFNELKELYRQVNLLFGNIIKVTPSSKVVGDTALFMLSNNLSIDQLLDQEYMRNISLPDSTLGYLKGNLGIPHVGMNKQLLMSALQMTEEEVEKHIQNIKEGRQKLPDLDLQNIKQQLINDYGNNELNAMCYAMYPNVYKQFQNNLEKYGNLIKELPCNIFLFGMHVNEEVQIFDNYTKQIINIKLLRIKPESFYHQVTFIFMINGQQISINITKQEQVQQKIRMCQDKNKELQALVLGQISKIFVKQNEFVTQGQILMIISSSKLEVKIYAQHDGTIKELCQEGEKVIPGAWIATIE